MFYDSSSFVADTIDEVEKTLGIAFVLVVLVVFLFLGNVRATIIPIVAIPVSLIGTFAVLLAARLLRQHRLAARAWCWASASSWMTRSWWWRTSSA